MKIDLVGPRQRGLAMGLNEFAGYLAVGASALATGWIAGRYGLRPEPFYLGVAFVAVGLVLSVLAVRETAGHASLEASDRDAVSPGRTPAAGEVFWRTTVADRNLSSASQAGLVSNLNDGVAWGVFPVLFAASAGLDLAQVASSLRDLREARRSTFSRPAAHGTTYVAVRPFHDTHRVSRDHVATGPLPRRRCARHEGHEGTKHTNWDGFPPGLIFFVCFESS